VDVASGPNTLLLYLRFGPATVVQLPHPKSEPIDADRVRGAVAAGVARANDAGATRPRAAAIVYRVEYFSERLVALAAASVVERYAMEGARGFTPATLPRSDTSRRAASDPRRRRD